MSRFDHPTAEELYLDLKKTMPSLSLATVYRNLKILEENGKIVRISGNDAEHFDGNIKEHCHLTCNNCKRIIDIELSDTEMIDSLPKAFDGKITSHSLMYFGLCPECSKG